MLDLLNFLFVFIELKISNILECINYFSAYLFFDESVKDLEDFLFGFFDKNRLLYYMNMWNFIKYFFYSNIKKIMLYIYYYIIQIFLIVIYNNMPNKFVKTYLYYHYTLQKPVLYIKKYIMLRYIKKWRFWRRYYRFSHISYLKILFFFLFAILFILMWKRRHTYLKRVFLWNLILFYMVSLIISFLMWPLFYNKFLSICVSLLISFFIIFYRLN